MFKTLDPNYVPEDLYKVSFKFDRDKCWEGIDRFARRQFIKHYMEEQRTWKEYKVRAKAEADLQKVIAKHPALKGKVEVLEFSYL